MLDSPLLYFGLQRRLRAIVLLTLLDTVSSQSSICVAHLSICIQTQNLSHVSAFISHETLPLSTQILHMKNIMQQRRSEWNSFTLCRHQIRSRPRNTTQQAYSGIQSVQESSYSGVQSAQESSYSGFQSIPDSGLLKSPATPDSSLLNSPVILQTSLLKSPIILESIVIPEFSHSRVQSFQSPVILESSHSRVQSFQSPAQESSHPGVQSSHSLVHSEI